MREDLYKKTMSADGRSTWCCFLVGYSHGCALM
jgi:hypothetical protein